MRRNTPAENEAIGCFVLGVFGALAFGALVLFWNACVSAPPFFAP